ncbi:MAG: DUF4434 domain-containing protein [Lentisphaeria bacterium]|nr:DUF4434 domain-containing protein [Lentisphaeria bacterium]
MHITGTFLDEISWDIPHQNWGEKEWDADFAAMKAIGIDTVIMIRSGLRRFMTYPSKVLANRKGCYTPPVDLVELYLRLAEKYGMTFYFGTYDGNNWHPETVKEEIAICCDAASEAFDRYGKSPAFGGWYLSTEISRKSAVSVENYSKLGKHCKEISGNLPVLISPFIGGIKANPNDPISYEQHEKEWSEILSAIQGSVDIVAFQDGHCEYDELAEYLRINKRLMTKYGMESWTNCETFDRDMPIHFLPIKWEKMLLKLEAAREAGMTKAITFEFSHFMSPNSCYRSAGNLYNRYREHFNI